MFFVMLRHPSHYVRALPLMKDEDSVEFFDTRESAEEAAEDNNLGANYGYDIFQLGNSE